MTTLIIARHGNTFEKGEVPTRVGARTDISLTEKGREQATAIGVYLKAHNLLPDITYSSTLKRTIETAEIAVSEAGVRHDVRPLCTFDEIDYGPDENKPEEDVVARIGEEAIKKWDESAVVPDSWKVDPEQIIKDWYNFADGIIKQSNKTILVVTSNGIARFAPYITGDFEGFRANNNIKIATGALCVLQYQNNKWSVVEWNIKP